MRITILGTGSWGLTLGKMLHSVGHQIVFWTHSTEEAEMLARTRAYPDKMPGIQFPADFRYFTHMGTAMTGAEVVLLVVPSQFMASVAKQMAAFTPEVQPIVVSATKGISESSLQRMSEILLSGVNWLDKDHMVVLSGPSHAEEVARGIATTVVAACPNLNSASIVQKAFTAPYFRIYTSTDQVGVELAGSLKNVIAIATGILDGLGLGDNTKGALMTRGLHEITRLGVSLGADSRTFAGLAGMGDLITTCTSKHSRNRHVGEHVGKGEALTKVLSEMTMVAEGVPTCRSALALARRQGVEMPITEAIHEVLFSGKPAEQAIRDLMARELKHETV